MKIEPEKRLFWFLKEGVRLNLEKPEERNLYVQQVLSHGSAKDVKQLLVTVPPVAFRESFRNVWPFLPLDVKNFWEHYLAGH